MKIYLATDHAGFELKNVIKEHLEESGIYEMEDCGAFTYEPLDDYPDYIFCAANKVSNSPVDSRAVIFGGSGQGEAMLANRYKNVRAAVYYGGPREIVSLSREHNDSNILSLGARFVTPNEAIAVVDLWLATAHLSDDKYSRRVKKAERLSTQR